MYERSRFHPPFTALVWRFPHRCVLDGPSIEPGLAVVSSSHPPRPSLLCLPSLLHPNALFAWGVDTPGVARTFYYTDEASRLLTDTTHKLDTQRFQVAAVMGCYLKCVNVHIHNTSNKNNQMKRPTCNEKIDLHQLQHDISQGTNLVVLVFC